MPISLTDRRRISRLFYCSPDSFASASGRVPVLKKDRGTLFCAVCKSSDCCSPKLKRKCRVHVSMTNLKYYHSHKKQYLLLGKEWRVRNPEKIAVIKMRWLKKNPWKVYLSNAKARCKNPKINTFKYYGGRGIKCLLTTNEIKFLWHRDCAVRMEHPSIDRINPDGNYVLENCRFIEMSENRKNRRPNGTVFSNRKGERKHENTNK